VIVENAEEIHKAMDTAIAAVQVLTKDEEISDVEVEEIEQEPGTYGRDRGDLNKVGVATLSLPEIKYA
jgi:hypothetical protein